MKDYFKSFMISFGSQSLFTNKLLKETIEIILTKLFKDKNGRVEALKRFQFERLFRTATKESHFYFKGNYFKRIYGVSIHSITIYLKKLHKNLKFTAEFEYKNIVIFLF